MDDYYVDPKTGEEKFLVGYKEIRLLHLIVNGPPTPAPHAPSFLPDPIPEPQRQHFLPSRPEPRQIEPSPFHFLPDPIPEPRQIEPAQTARPVPTQPARWVPPYPSTPQTNRILRLALQTLNNRKFWDHAATVLSLVLAIFVIIFIVRVLGEEAEAPPPAQEQEQEEEASLPKPPWQMRHLSA